MVSFRHEKDLQYQSVRVFGGTGGHTVPAVKSLPQQDEPDTKSQMIYSRSKVSNLLGRLVVNEAFSDLWNFLKCMRTKPCVLSSSARLN